MEYVGIYKNERIHGEWCTREGNYDATWGVIERCLKWCIKIYKINKIESGVERLSSLDKFNKY